MTDRESGGSARTLARVYLESLRKLNLSVTVPHSLTEK
jgi:hypothetical protein